VRRACLGCYCAVAAVHSPAAGSRPVGRRDLPIVIGAADWTRLGHSTTELYLAMAAQLHGCRRPMSGRAAPVAGCGRDGALGWLPMGKPPNPSSGGAFPERPGSHP
jgi:hypothetical protein